MIPFTGTLRLLLGTFYPAYASYKAIRTKNVREYVKWMMYWIVFALFTSIETFTDIFVAFWFPFYYELKILFLIWLISPVSKGSLGSSILYRRFVHPTLINREEEIDQMSKSTVFFTFFLSTFFCLQFLVFSFKTTRTGVQYCYQTGCQGF